MINAVIHGSSFNSHHEATIGYTAASWVIDSHNLISGHFRNIGSQFYTIGSQFNHSYHQKELLMDKIKYAVIGLGWFGEKHCEAIADLPNAELYALCTRTPERLKE